MAGFLRCESREAQAWLLSTFGDKSQTLLDVLHHIKTDYGLELYVNNAIPVRTFTKDVANGVNDIMTKAAESLDFALGRIPCGSKTATRYSMRIAKDLCLLALSKTGFRDENGRLMSVSSFCEMLEWRRLDKRQFISEDELEQYDKELNDYWTVKESRELLKRTYARIKEEI